MCARIAYLLLGSIFVFVVVTIASFVYLEWWQALAVSFLTFVGLIWIAKWAIKILVGRGLGSIGRQIFEAKSRVLRRATADIHGVTRTSPPPETIEVHQLIDGEEPPPPSPDLQWYEIETTIFPDQAHAGPMANWDLDDLRLVPFSAQPLNPTMNFDEDSEDDFELHHLVVIENGEPIVPDQSKFSGPLRIRFRVGVPAGVQVLAFRYYFEQFGRIELPSRLALR